MASRNRGEMTDEMTAMQAVARADADAHEQGGKPKQFWKVSRNSRGVPTLCNLPIRPTITLINSDPDAPGGVLSLVMAKNDIEVRGQALRDWCDFSVARGLGKEAHEPGSERTQVARPKRVVGRKTKETSQDAGS